jgi:serine protease AprX
MHELNRHFGRTKGHFEPSSEKGIRMKRFLRRIPWSLLFASGVIAAGAADSDPRCSRTWIFFKDRGSARIEKTNVRAEAGRLGISGRALKVRRKVRPQGALLDETDLPVDASYCAVLERQGVTVLSRSRWLNAVAAAVPKGLEDKVRSLPFVSGLRPVAALGVYPPARPLARPSVPAGRTEHAYDYGYSYTQNMQIRIPELHDLGITGKGVLIGLMDSGFDPENRPVFRNLRIAAERDFWDGNGETSNEAGDVDSQHNHGTEVLSVIGGYLPGELIGPAFNASYALAKTEWIPFERKIEEDKWVLGIEWLTDSVGVDLVSTSLGYNLFDDKAGYTPADLDGRTCVTTKAAEIAASKGVVVVNSAGNEGDNAWQKVDSPADGAHVIAAGAVSLEGRRAAFSSLGPTADGRIKPDVAAMGVGVACEDPNRDNGSGTLFVSGTSFSAPLVAGACALLLEARPEMTPDQVLAALRATGSQAANPDTLLGWGIVDALGALFHDGMAFMNFTAVCIPFEARNRLEFDVLSSSGLAADSVTVYWTAENSQALVPARAVRVSDRHFRADIPDWSDPERLLFYISAFDTLGRESLGPLGAPSKRYAYAEIAGPPGGGETDSAEGFTVRNAYPNPFSNLVRVDLDAAAAGVYELAVIDIRGRRVRAFPSVFLECGRASFSWDGLDNDGKTVPDGTYLFRIRSAKGASALKVVKMAGFH